MNGFIPCYGESWRLEMCSKEQERCVGYRNTYIQMRRAKHDTAELDHFGQRNASLSEI